jgi:hypothetical protein
MKRAIERRKYRGMRVEPTEPEFRMASDLPAIVCIVIGCVCLAVAFLCWALGDQFVNVIFGAWLCAH